MNTFYHYRSGMRICLFLFVFGFQRLLLQCSIIVVVADTTTTTTPNDDSTTNDVANDVGDDSDGGVGVMMGSDINLTSTNYHDITSNNRTVFIKWAVPWCTHSQTLEPIWDQLVDEYSPSTSSSTNTSSSSSVLLAQVDCQKESDWCTAMGYTAFPTLTYGDPSMGGIFLHTYQSLDRSYETLKRFVEVELSSQSFCTPGNLHVCSETTRTKIQWYMNMTSSLLDTTIQREEDQIRSIEDRFDETNELLQQQYRTSSRDYYVDLARRKRRMKILQNIITAKQTTTGG